MGTHAIKKLVARLFLAVPMGMLVEWTQLEVTRWVELLIYGNAGGVDPPGGDQVGGTTHLWECWWSGPSWR